MVERAGRIASSQRREALSRPCAVLSQALEANDASQAMRGAPLALELLSRLSQLSVRA